MLIITSDGTRYGSWHVGETMTVPEGYVITFQADGHELDAILEAFRNGGIPVNYPAKRLTLVL